MAFGPLDEQPLGRSWLGARVIPMGCTHPNPRKARTQLRISANVTDDFGNVTGLSGRC